MLWHIGVTSGDALFSVLLNRYTYKTIVKCLVDEPISGPVVVYITKPPNPAPLMTVSVDMPVAEGMDTVR